MVILFFFFAIYHFLDDCLLGLLPPSVVANETTAAMTINHKVAHSAKVLTAEKCKETST